MEEDGEKGDRELRVEREKGGVKGKEGVWY